MRAAFELIPSSSSPSPSRRLRVGKGRPYSPEIFEAVRALVEGTALKQREIAARVGIAQASVWRLARRDGWIRPARAGRRSAGCGRPFGPAIVAEAQRLVETTELSFAAIAARTGVSRTTLCRWRKRRKWARPNPNGDGRARPARYFRQRGRPYAADAVGRRGTWPRARSCRKRGSPGRSA
ncbi:helix-turn-helix domain-containing protein [uncultured Enterovirga sp.]|uniref:helix-turn-helix domain-containing protein n=1 Tax=uncultured Enterovirga sp. TaxID=2026352 RepID=UPI0035C9A754